MSLNSPRGHLPGSASPTSSRQFPKLSPPKLQKKEVTGHPPPIQTDPTKRDEFYLSSGYRERQKRFVVIGDAGTGNEHQMDVARQMEELYKRQPFGSVLPLGDNVYKYGQPKDFTAKIETPYKKLFVNKVKFYPVLGNHDVKNGHGADQLKYWGIKSPFYTYTLGSKNSKVQFWALDTTLLTPGHNGCYYTEIPEIQLDISRQRKAQLEWLERSLQDSNAPIKVVYGHYPLYSEGAKMDSEKLACQTELERILPPILERNGVDLYLSGHEHHYEKPRQVNGVHYMVSGAAGQLEEGKKAPQPTTRLLPEYHFVSFEITPEGLHYEAISDQGKTIDKGLIPKHDSSTTLDKEVLAPGEKNKVSQRSYSLPSFWPGGVRSVPSTSSLASANSSNFSSVSSSTFTGSTASLNTLTSSTAPSNTAPFQSALQHRPRRLSRSHSF